MKAIFVCLLFTVLALARASANTGALSVQVTDAVTGASIPGVSVRVQAGPAGITDADGAASLTGIPVPALYAKVTVNVTATGYDDAVWRDAEVYPDNTTILPFRMTRLGHNQVIQEPPHAMEQPGAGMNAGEPEDDSPPDGMGASALGPLPAYIRVWRKEKSETAGYTIVENIPFEEYVKGVVPSEWYSSWDPESLKAGAVAARTYGAYKVLHPKYPSIGADVSDTTATQVYRDSRVTSTNQATDATRSQVLTWNGGVINAEYSAENADPTTAGPFPYQPSVADPVCAGKTLNGHGRGLCQWGSQRWATGATGSDGRKTYDWILSHYYGSATQLQIAGDGLQVGDCAMVEGAPASVRATPNGAYIATLPLNTQVHLLQGPVTIGISRWWRIAWSLPAPTRFDGWVTDAYLVEIPCPTMTVALANIAVTDATSYGATIKWDSDVSASSVVHYGTTAESLGLSATGAAGTSHTVPLSGLQPGSDYYFQVQSAASGYITATSAVQTFTTPGLAGDVDGDGDVTMADAAVALRIAGGMDTSAPSEVIRADVVDADGLVTLSDALAILVRALEPAEG